MDPIAYLDRIIQSRLVDIARAQDDAALGDARMRVREVHAAADALIAAGVVDEESANDMLRHLEDVMARRQGAEEEIQRSQTVVRDVTVSDSTSPRSTRVLESADLPTPRIIPLAQHLGSVRQIRHDVVLASLEIWPASVHLRYALSPVPTEREHMRPSWTWEIRDDVGTRYAMSGGGGNLLGGVWLESVVFRPSTPAEATTLVLVLRLLQSQEQLRRIDLNLSG